jgi:trigger factor
VTQKQEFNNDKVSVTVERQPKCKVELSVTLLPQLANEIYEESIKYYQKGVSEPGFRKGKVPKNMVIAKYKGMINEHYQSKAPQAAFAAACSLTELYPIDRSGNVRLHPHSPLDIANGGTLKFTYEVFPIIPTLDPEAIKIKDIPLKPVDDTVLKRHLTQLIVSKSKFEDISDRPAQEHDVISFNYSPMEFQDDVRELKDLYLDKEITEELIYQAIVGMTLNETKENVHLVKQDPKADQAPLFKVTLTHIKAGQLTEVNDELASQFGFKTTQELFEAIEKHYKDQNEAQRKEQLAERLEEKLLEMYHFDVPASIEENETKRKTDHLMETLERENKTPSEEELNKLKESIAKNANNYLRITYLLNHYAREHKIEPTQNELMSNLYKNHSQYFSSLGDDKDMWERLTQLNRHEVILQKTLSTILDKIKLES